MFSEIPGEFRPYIDGYRYYIVSEKLNFADAKNYCLKKYDAHLVPFNSLEMIELITQKMEDLITQTLGNVEFLTNRIFSFIIFKFSI